MNIILYGSKTSPFVRRVRLFLIENKLDYDFELVNVYAAEEIARYQKVSPTLRIPALQIDNQVIWDSLVIIEHLRRQPFSLQQQQQLVLLNEASDAGVYLFQAKHFEVDIEHQKLPAKRAKQRLQTGLNYFEAKPELLQWDVLGMGLFCLLDWLMFRSVIATDDFVELRQFHQDQLHRSSIKQTCPRIA